ncbi:MAG: hypothetical protein QOI37_125 [Chloroflexota bacterium]|nr:hypothetical protein [Chloroflexota bacterium]
MTFPRLWAFLAVGLPVLAALIANLPSVDLTYHLRAGAEILAGGGIPTVDHWTFTAAGVPWTDQQWGAQVILAAVYQLGGWTGLVVLRAILVGIIFGSLLAIGLRLGLGPRRAAWLTLAGFVVAAVALGLRPQLLGMAVFALVLLLVSDRHANPRRLWLIPLLVLVWANLHGSFFLGPAVLGLAWLADLHSGDPGARRVLLIGVVSGLAACATPFGPAVWLYAVGLSTNPAVTARITEWQPTSLRSIPGILFFASVLALVALVARRGRQVPWPTLIWLGAFFILGTYAIRGVAWWSMGAIAAIAGVVVAEPEFDRNRPTLPDPPRVRRLNLVLAGAIVLAGVALLPPWRPIDPALGAPAGVVGNAPPGITAELRAMARPTDRLFNPQPWGSWFEFALPDLPVAIDSRIELFPPGVWDAYERIAAGGDGWATQLKAWGATIAVAGPEEFGFTARLAAMGWRTTYTDPDGSVLVAPDR